MAEATGLGVQSIRTSLNKLKSTGELTVETPHGYSLIQVNNWQKYQDTNTPSNRRTNRRLTGDQQATNNKQELKNERIKELKNNTLGDLKSPEGDPFEIFWKAYPRKTGKEAARKIWIRLRPSKLLLDKMIYAIKEQRASDQWQKDGGQFIPHPATWLNQGRWQDEQIEKERPKVKHSDITGYDSLGRPLYNLD